MLWLAPLTGAPVGTPRLVGVDGRASRMRVSRGAGTAVLGTSTRPATRGRIETPRPDGTTRCYRDRRADGAQRLGSDRATTGQEVHSSRAGDAQRVRRKRATTACSSRTGDCRCCRVSVDELVATWGTSVVVFLRCHGRSWHSASGGRWREHRAERHPQGTRWPGREGHALMMGLRLVGLRPRRCGGGRPDPMPARQWWCEVIPHASRWRRDSPCTGDLRGDGGVRERFDSGPLSGPHAIGRAMPEPCPSRIPRVPHAWRRHAQARG